MSHITREEILKLAQVAKITVTEDEIPTLLAKLESFISYASYLQEVAEKHEGAPLPKMSNVTRSDEVVPADTEPLLELAPQREDDYYVVPVILKQ